MERWLEIWNSLVWLDARTTAGGLALIAVLTSIEQVVPAERGQGARSRLRNLAFLVQYKLLGLGALAIYFAYGPDPVRIGVDWSTIAPPLRVFANLLAIDFLFYLYHRAQHRFRPLWAIHELHHADEELNATTSYRTYWLEILAQTLTISIPTALFFGDLGERHALIVIGISIVMLVFTHANLRLPFGPLSVWICGPQVHRIHHSRLPGDRDRNFAQFFPFLDLLFGTYKAPARDEYPPTGADELPGDASLARVMARPFAIWAQTLGLSGARRPFESGWAGKGRTRRSRE